ncbi:lysophospholipid acyltransferase family protein [Salimicrobium flavidum]|uniref:1-acyl-sn-glycerol-3-phosphate acyltransferase n=1 Tax=Salimicrobium flavidum TaxID=570947 RepID=A0A1N7IME4_9BACI|nr:lysophospholipid acyltransferase family protein [Salimicrobium flavidum]SIS38258.1 1-acyl-sn-glycerol-3-phosphate acyltransferase [Salimicrobium flavidum]
MKRSTKNRWVESGFRTVSRTLLRQEFHSISVSVTDHPLPSYGIFLMNHSSWWDGLLAHLINDKVLKTDAHIMIDEEGMNRFPVFSYVGGFSVDQSSLSHTKNSLLYAEDLLKQKKGVFLFPQGDEQHQELRPLKFLKGAAFLMKRVPSVPVTPILFYYSFGHYKKPEVYIKIGVPIWEYLPVQKWETIMEQELDSLKQKVIKEDFHSFTPLL